MDSVLAVQKLGHINTVIHVVLLDLSQPGLFFIVSAFFGAIMPETFIVMAGIDNYPSGGYCYISNFFFVASIAYP